MSAFISHFYAEVRHAGARGELFFCIFWLAWSVINIAAGEWWIAALEFFLFLAYLQIALLTVVADLTQQNCEMRLLQRLWDR